MLCRCSNTYCCYDATSKKLKFSSEGLIKRMVEQSGDGLLGKYRKVLEETVNITLPRRSFRTKDHTVAKYEQIKRGLL